jgi:Flp pilus assembly protein TadB
MNDWTLPIALGILAGASVFAIFVGLIPRQRVIRAQRETLLQGIQVRLDRARLGVSAAKYVARSLAYGAAFGMLMALATGAWLTFFAGLVAGFAFVWSQLEDERNQGTNTYNKALASAADTIVSSWKVKPSMNRALQIVAQYGQGQVADDFDKVRAAMRAGESLAQAFQRIADRRQSPVFDALATALIVAEESSGEVSQMLARQAQSTREMARIYEETIDKQRGQRADVMWGILGPWGVILLLRLATMLVGGLGYGADFFTTPVGQVSAMVAAGLTVVAYVHSRRTAARGLIVERVPLERGQDDEPTPVSRPSLEEV